LAAEAIQFAASRAFEQHTDGADGLWEELHAQPEESGAEDGPSVEDR
jgi:hypothetical protein